MSQKEFNKEIANYIEQKKLREDKTKDVERIKKQADEMSVSDAHPDLEVGKVHVIKKDDPWLKRIVQSVKSKPKPEEPEQEAEAVKPEDKEFMAEEQKLETELGQGYWQRFVAWLKGREPSSEEFQAEMGRLEEEEEALEKQEEQIKEEEAEVHREKSNLIMDFLSRFRPRRRVSALQEQVFDLEDDLKQIAKITTSVIKQLPPEQVHIYKKSQDFEQFKEILRKRNLIKEKEA